MTVGFEIFGPDYQSAYSDGGNISHAVLDALHRAGVEDKSIESSDKLEQNTSFDDKDKPDQRAKKQYYFVSRGK